MTPPTGCPAEVRVHSAGRSPGHEAAQDHAFSDAHANIRAVPSSPFGQATTSRIIRRIGALEHGWTSVRTFAALGIALAALATFAAWERHTATPMLDLALLRHSPFARRLRRRGAAVRPRRHHVRADPVPAARSRLQPARRRAGHPARRR